MRGLILAGGTGSRLAPMTNITNKHLLPVYDKPMIFYPIETLKSNGITDIMIITGVEHAGDFMTMLGSGKNMGLNFTYRIQDQAGGIAEALGLCKDFAGDGNIAVILGDNVFDKIQIPHENDGALIYLKAVPAPERFGVAEIDSQGKIKNIEEKPKQPKSNLCVTGLYIYDKRVWDIVDQVGYSARGEMEITDVNNAYANMNCLKYRIVEGFWSDAGTPKSLYVASTFMKEKGAKEE
jgi:glucose-1-phosphate thymidylyltransferase